VNTLLLLLVICPLLGSGIVAGLFLLAVTVAWLARFFMVEQRRGRSLRDAALGG
jgi:hypothetical protein